MCKLLGQDSAVVDTASC